MSVYIETERLILREPSCDDAEALARSRSTEFVMRYNLYRPSTREQICRELECYEHILLVSKEDNRLIGCISIRDDDFRYHVDSVLIQAWLTEENARQGYMSEALRAMLRELFCVRNHERVSAQIMSENIASIKLVESLGFIREGYLKRAVRCYDGRVLDVCLYSLDSEEYHGSDI